MKKVSRFLVAVLLLATGPAYYVNAAFIQANYGEAYPLTRCFVSCKFHGGISSAERIF